MALQVGVHKFVGRLDNVIGYRRNGKYFFRSMPDKIRQTSATRRASRYFGIASRKGKLIRTAFRPHLDMRYDTTLVNRLNKLFIGAGRNDFPNLKGFHFNRHTGLDKMFLIPPVFTTNGTLHIPAQEMLPQGVNTHLEVRLIAVRIDLPSLRVLSSEASTAIINLDENEPFNGLALSVPTEGEGILMVALQCRACVATNGVLYPSYDRRYMAADVIHLVVPINQITNTKATHLGSSQRTGFRKPPKRITLLSSLRETNGASSPSLQGINGPTSPSQGANGSSSPLQGINGLSSPSQGANGSSSPLQEVNGPSSPSQGANRPPSPSLRGPQSPRGEPGRSNLLME
jgi:hypothetical protein